MIVIVEGCDKTGKTTLAQTLSKRTGLSYSHSHISSESDLFRKYNELIQAISRPTIADRFYPSELVYGPLMRGHSRISITQFHKLNTLIQSQGGCFIYCFANPQMIINRFKNDKEEYLSATLVPDAIKKYEEIIAIAGRSLPVFTYDSGLSQSETSNNTDKLVGLIQKRMTLYMDSKKM